MSEIETKVCTKCGVEKSLEMFYKDKAKKDGLQGKCKECVKAYKQANAEKISERARDYYQANHEVILKQTKAYRQANAEKTSEHKKEYYQDNREKIAEYYKAYFQTQTGKAIAKNSRHKRRAKTKQGDVTTQQLLELKNNAKTCFWCGAPLDDTAHVDHFYPLSTGGEHTLSNLRMSCPSCNQRKGNKDPYVFAKIIGKGFE